ncbi:MAG: class I SAM-dependent DNA methyltransferase [Thermoanaerobaculia bacterium]
MTPLDRFIARWSASGDAERANKDSFLNELCDVLGVERPHPKTGFAERDLYVFEKDVARSRAGGMSVGRVDLYKHGSFLLEAKQGAAAGPKRRDSPAWNQMMSAAHGQALGYAAHLDAPPPFLLVCDIGYCFDVYASFDGTGVYRAFPDGHRKRFFLADLAEHADLLRAVWTDPQSLDPSKRTAAVTRDVAEQIAALARALEAAGQDPERVATFLMRCLFTMFAEDVGLLPEKPFSHALENWWIPNPASFPGGVGSLWQAMDRGGDFVTGKLLRFNGGLFSTHDAPVLTKEQLILLLMAAKSDWSQVDPSIFGTLLERALNPRERHRLGAHYTPRAYVERLVKPTIEEPLRGDWDLVRAEVRQLVEAGKVEDAQKRVLAFHHQLCRARVLDPACGTGNFLYVTLDLFKRLESEVLALLAELGYRQIGLEMERYRVTPEQFLGIEVKRWAKEIAELVLWIGYLQWQVRQPGGAKTVPQPVLRDYGNIECRDAVLAYDHKELLLDGNGKPVTRWDDETMKISPVTGEEIPAEEARVPVYRYVNPRQAEWPAADFIVGNPPYIGNWRMRQVFGDGYVESLRAIYPEVPQSTDYVLYWWHRAAAQVCSGATRRFGLITTNSISQSLGRRVVERSLLDQGGSIVFAVPDHPWVNTEDGAAVRVAMTVGEKGYSSGKLYEVAGETQTDDDYTQVDLAERHGRIHANLTVGVDVSSSTPLQATDGLSSRGVSLHGAGFILSAEEAKALDAGRFGTLVRPYVNGRDLTAAPRGAYVIDFFGLSESEARQNAPELYQWLVDHVKHERLAKAPGGTKDSQEYATKWWLFGKPRAELRRAIGGLRRFIATVETAKHRIFVFLDRQILPDNKLICIASDAADVLGTLSSRIHVCWALAAGATLEDRPVYVKSTCFDPFPFPVCSEAQKQRIRALGEALDVHRKRQQALHPKLTITGMYNVLEKLRSGEPLTDKEREIHEQGLVSVLKQIHDDLDAAVFEAYGWPATLTDDEILERLVALNHERAEEEKRGLVRWLRPEFQNPQGTKAATQVSLTEAGLETAEPALAAKGRKAAKLPWPKDLPARVVAVRDLLAELGEATAADVSRRFKGAQADQAEKLLESLAAVGVALETEAQAGATRTWSLVR